MHVKATDLNGDTPDPWALAELASDIRPRDYAADHVRQIEILAGLDVAIVVASLGRPEWLSEIMTSAVVTDGDVGVGLSTFSRP